MKEATFFRKQNVIRGPDGDQVFASLNKAKKASRAIQIKADGVLGIGTLRVVEKLPDLSASESAESETP